MELFDFRKQEDQMLALNDAWNNTDDPSLFWQKITGVNPQLSKIAWQLWSVAANSVPSERTFSTINYLHSELRNQLSPEQAN